MKKLTALLALVLAATALVACGDDSDSDTPTTGTATTTEAAGGQATNGGATGGEGSTVSLEADPDGALAYLAFLEMGAAGVQLGTRFVCATESIAHPRFKQAFIRGAARDAVPTVQIDERFPVIPVRALQNEGTRRFMEHQAAVLARFMAGEVSKEAAQLEIEHFWAGALRRAVLEGDVENGSLMAGQSIGMVTREQPVAAILDELMAQADGAIAARGQ